jgi:lipoyl(octanoyl) transferase
MLADPLSLSENCRIPSDGVPVEWAVSSALVPYEEAVAFMEARVAAIAAGEAAEMVWLLEHPPLYTAGVSSKDADLLDAGRFPVHRTGRGGQFTYHGPGQRVAYVMLDLNRRGRDVRAFVRGLEQWIIGALDRFGVQAGVREGRVGVCGSSARGRAGHGKTKSPPSASRCANGSAFTASA